MLRLHDFDLSAECYAVRLFAALVGAALEIVSVDVYPGRENEREPFLTLNALATVPVLETEGLVLRDWQAILSYLAFGHDPAGAWWPANDPELLEWLGSARRLGSSSGLARLHDGMGEDADVARCRREAHALLREIERSLWFGERDEQSWLMPGPRPSVADIAVFVHVILCEEGGISRMDYPAVRRWTDRIRRLPSFVPMSGIFSFPAPVAA